MSDDQLTNITPATFDELKIGDRVRHTSCGEGTVLAKNETVDVEFDQGGKHGKWTGRYDRRWFGTARSALVKLSI